jgi:hypothetical protein
MTFLSATEQIIVLLLGVSSSSVFIIVGVLIKKYKWYQPIAGYNTASEAEKNWTYCPECEGWSWQKIRKKTQQEKRLLP